MSLYGKGECEQSYLQELYGACDTASLMNMETTYHSSLEELYVQCSTAHQAAQCPATTAVATTTVVPTATVVPTVTKVIVVPKNT